MDFAGDLFSAVIEQGWWLAAMALLICLSAFFSGSEAALFSIRDQELRRIGLAGPTGERVRKLLNDPDRLLSAILFWNLLINMAYFAIAASLGGKLDANVELGSAAAIAFTMISLLTIIFLSEMLPKSVAVLSPVRAALWVATPMTVALRIVGPALPIVRASNVATRRLLWPTFEPEPDLDLTDIERAIELGTDDAALLQRERNALRGLIAMSETRADELMRPRSRLEIFSLPVDSQVMPSEDFSGGYLYFCRADDENIMGAIHARMIRPSQWEDLESAFEPVLYVAWSAKISQILDQLIDGDRKVAIVVNEFGESIGAISVEDILRSVLAPRETVEDEEDTIIALPDHRWRLVGTLSLRALTKHLQIDNPMERTATVAGYIQRFNERLPRVGDSATLAGYTLQVTEDDGANLWIEATPDEPPDTEESDG